MDDLEQLKILVSEIDKKLDTVIVEFNGKFDLLHQDLLNKDSQNREDISGLKSKILENKKNIQSNSKEIIELKTENTTLKATINTLKTVGGFVTFLIMAVIALLELVIK